MSSNAKTIWRHAGQIQVYPVGRGTWTVRAIFWSPENTFTHFHEKRWVGLSERDLAESVYTARVWLQTEIWNAGQEQ